MSSQVLMSLRRLPRILLTNNLAPLVRTGVSDRERGPELSVMNKQNYLVFSDNFLCRIPFATMEVMWNVDSTYIMYILRTHYYLRPPERRPCGSGLQFQGCWFIVLYWNKHFEVRYRSSACALCGNACAVALKSPLRQRLGFQYSRRCKSSPHIYLSEYGNP